MKLVKLFITAKKSCTRTKINPMNSVYSHVPLSLYIHIPWCIKKCPYCDFNSHQPKSPITQDQEDQYINALILDLKQNLDF